MSIHGCNLKKAVSILRPMMLGDDELSIEKQRNKAQEYCLDHFYCLIKEFLIKSNDFVPVAKTIREELDSPFLAGLKVIVFPIDPSTDMNNHYLVELERELAGYNLEVYPFYIME